MGDMDWLGQEAQKVRERLAEQGELSDADMEVLFLESLHQEEGNGS